MKSIEYLDFFLNFFSANTPWQDNIWFIWVESIFSLNQSKYANKEAKYVWIFITERINSIITPVDWICTKACDK